MKKYSPIILLCFCFGSTFLSPVSNSGQYAYAFGQNKVRYWTFDWKVYESPHFDIYYYVDEEMLLDEVVNCIESSYQTLSEDFDHELHTRIPVIVYKSHGEFEGTHIIPVFLPEGVAGFSEPLRNRLVMPLDSTPKETAKTFQHELTHIFQYSILYGRSKARIYRANPPGWFMEGLAEHQAEGYTPMDEMIVRDLVLNDQIPPLSYLSQISGYAADYVLGQVVFDYLVDEKGGKENLRDFIYDVRDNGVTNIQSSMIEVYQMDYEEFDREFRLYLREKYLGFLTEKDEPGDYGRRLKPKGKRPYPIYSPAVSPSGELIAALTINYRERTIDVGLFSALDGDKIKDVTRGWSRHYEYPIGQGLTVSDGGGRDLAWTPDGNEIVFLGRTADTRSLFFIDVTTRKMTRKIRLEIDQALSPAVSPDGKSVLLSGIKEGERDIYLLSLEDESLKNLTQDSFFDFTPIWSPDGSFIIFSTDLDGAKKLFKLDPDDPDSRVQLTFGKSSEVHPAFTLDGKRVLFASDKGRIFNLYSLDLETGEMHRHTDVYSGCFMPSDIVNDEDDDLDAGGEDILYTGFLKGQFSLYRMSIDTPIETFSPGREFEEEELADFKPLLDLQIDESNKRDKGMNFNIDDIWLSGGVGSDGTILSYGYVNFSDILNEHFMQVSFNTINTFGNIGFTYLNQTGRFMWGGNFYRQKSFFLTRPLFEGEGIPDDLAELNVAYMGGSMFGAYPLDRYHRFQVGVGVSHRSYSQGFLDAFYPNVPPELLESFQSGTYLPLSVSFIGDTTRWEYYGPYAGRRYRFDLVYSPNFGQGTIGFTNFITDFRNYLLLTRNSSLAFRFWGGFSFGEAPSVFAFGGTNTMRGWPYMSFSGNYAWFANTELRFPFVEALKFPVMPPLQLRGFLFFDLGAAWYKGQDFDFLVPGDFRLKDGAGSFGFGVVLNLGIFELNFAFSKLTDFRSVSGGLEVDFYIAQTF